MENQTVKQVDKKNAKQTAKIADVLAKLDIVLEELKTQRESICRLEAKPNKVQAQFELLNVKMDKNFSEMASDMHTDFTRLLAVVGAGIACGLLMVAL